ncbi:MAG: virulence factor [Acidimicrobiales bacterium]|nr:virulence factor [Acidimicrobiales bacterium]
MTAVAHLVTIYWRDIPAQVTAQRGRSREKALLDARFQDAIDRSAIVAGLADADSYLAEWRRVTAGCNGDMAAVVAAEAARLEDAYPGDRLERLIRAGGVED